MASLAELEKQYGVVQSGTSLADLERQYGLQDAPDEMSRWLDRPVGYRLSDLDIAPRPAPQGLFMDEKERAGFDDMMDPMYFGRATGIHFERDDEDKLKAYYSMTLDLPPAFIDQHSDWITEALLGARANAKTAGQRIKDNWRNGQIHVQMSDLGFEVLMGTDTPETWSEIKRLKGEFVHDPAAQFRSWWEKMLSATADIVPYSIEGIKAAPLGAGAGGLAGGLAGIALGQMGPQALLPEESVTVPAMIWGGVKLGGGTATAYRIGQLEAGGAILDMLDIGIDPSIARAAAAGIGVLNGSIEVLQIGTLLRTLPGGKKLAAATIQEVVNKLIAEHTLRNLAVRHTAQYGAHLATQTIQELGQESVSVVGEQLAAVLHEKLKGKKVKTETIDEILARFREVGAKSVQGFAVLALPGSVASGVMDVGETVVMRGSPAWRMMPDVRATHVKVPVPEVVAAEAAPTSAESATVAVQPQAAQAVESRTPGQVAEAERQAQPGIEAAQPQPQTRPGQTTAVLETAVQTHLRTALEQFDREALVERAKRIGVSTDGTKAQLAARIADAIYARVSGKQTVAERRAVSETEAAIAEHPLYREAAERTAADPAQPSPGLNDAALAEALQSGEPELAILARKREMLRDRSSIWQINQEIHGLAAESKLALADYEHLLIGREIASPPGEAHPGSLSFEDFKDQLGRELVDKDSPWLRRWTIPNVAEVPKAMWERLRREWQGIEAHEMATELDIKQVAHAILTPEQKAELNRIDAEAATEQALDKYKTMSIGRLQGGIYDAAVEVKRLRRALLQAYRAGTKEGIAAARQAYRAAKKRLKARREVRAHVKRLMREIHRPVGKSVAFIQRMAIQLIQQHLDPKFRRLSTIEKRRRSQAFFEAHPEAEVPKKTLKRIESVAPNELTVAQLEDIAKIVRELKRKGQLLRKAANARMAARQQADIDAALDAIGRPTQKAPTPIVARPVVLMRQKIADAFRAALTPERVLDWFDGRKLFKGKMFDLFWQAVADVEAAKTEWIQKRSDSARKALSDTEMSIADLQQPMMVLGENTITVQQALGIYLFEKNLASELAQTFGNEISKAQQKMVADAVEADPRLVQLANYVLEHYEEHRERLREAVIVVEDRDMGYEENYTPMRRMEMNYTPDERSLIEEMLEREHYRRGHVEKGMTLARKDIAPEYQKPIRLDAWTLLLEQIERQEHYIAFAGLVKRLRAIVNDKGVQAALTEKHGPGALEWLQSYVDVVANPNIYKTYSQAGRFARMLRRNTTLAYLTWNIRTLLKMSVSVVRCLPYAGYHLLQAGLEASTEWSRVREFVVSRDPMVGDVALERELEEIKAADPAAYRNVVRRFGEAGLKPLVWFDAPGRTIGWYGVWLAEHAKAVADGLDAPAADQRATKTAREVISRTQAGARAFQLPALYRSGEEWLNLLLQFTNELNKAWNIATYDLPSLVANKKYGQSAMVVVAMATEAYLIWTISNGRPPQDEDDFEEIVLEGLVGMVPVVGNNIVSGAKGFRGGDIAATEGAAEFLLNVGEAGKGLWEGDLDLKALRDAYRGAAPFVGVPYSGPKTLIEFGVTGNPYYLVGGPPKKSKSGTRKRQ